jgi:ribonuclease HII
MITEKKRLKSIQIYEENARKEGYNIIAGVDEAGRGPWAGPVVAGAVILPENIFINGINDSKKLTPQKREELFLEINKKALAVSTGICEVSVIDSVNILNATYIAMHKALSGLKIKPDIVFIDGNPVPHMGFTQISIVKGDSKSISIAAASIIAKVTRDRLMIELADIYPEYKFDKHKGYGTKKHRELLEIHGVSDIHRKSFKPVRDIFIKRKDMMQVEAF